MAESQSRNSTLSREEIDTLRSTIKSVSTNLWIGKHQREEWHSKLDALCDMALTSLSERGAWIAVKDKLPDYKSPAENFVLGWFPGMNKPDVFSALTVRHWALDDDPIPGAIWQPLPALPAIPGERSESQ